MDRNRPWRRLYSTAAWKRLAAAQRAREPLCRYCLAQGVANDGSLTADGQIQTVPRRATLVADHIVPHKGDVALFHDPENLQSLCADHHDRQKQAEERRGFSELRAADGWPVDPRHPANRS